MSRILIQWTANQAELSNMVEACTEEFFDMLRHGQVTFQYNSKVSDLFWR